MLFKKSLSYYFSAALPSFDYTPQPYKGIPYEKVISDRNQYSKDHFLHYYKQPLLIVDGKMQYLFDHQGKRYQDWISGISTVSIGHSHPKLVEAMIDQSQKLVQVSQINLTSMQAEYAKMLCDKLGDGFDSVYFTNSGSEANDFAISLSRLYTKKHKFLSVRNGYHGIVGNASSITNMPNWHNNATRGKQFEKLSWPSKYRGILRTADDLIREAEEVIQSNASGKIAGMLLQSIQGIGGINILVDGYIPRIYETVQKHGGLMICDEVQTGFGRIGQKYWGHRLYGVKPDIVTFAKGIANGLPLGAVVTRRQVADAIDHNFFNTTGGGPVQIRAAIQVIKAIEGEGLDKNCEKVGAYLLTELEKIKNDSHVVGDVRGKGLMIGIQIVKDKTTKESSKEMCNQMMEKLRQRNILIGRGGSGANVLRLQPPFCMSMDDAKYFLSTFSEIAKSYR